MDKPDYVRRMDRLRGLLERKRLRLMLVTDLLNVRYLCGFTGSNGILLVCPGEVVFFTDGRYQEQAPGEVVGCRVLIVKGARFLNSVITEIRRAAPRRLGIEARNLTVATHNFLGKRLRNSTNIQPTVDLVEQLRARKDAWELARIHAAARIADRAFKYILGRLRAGVTEIGIRRDLDDFMLRNGAEKPSFESIVLFGARSSLPHGQPGVRRLRKGDWILMDFGAVVDGYHSDMTRTVVKGRATPEMKKTYNLVLRAQTAAIRAMRAGARNAAIDEAARSVFRRAGRDGDFMHGLGHSVGLDFHEEPHLGSRSKDRLIRGNVLTVEPGLYVSDWGGIRIEDMVVVEKSGTKRLTRSPRRLIEV